MNPSPFPVFRCHPSIGVRSRKQQAGTSNAMRQLQVAGNSLIISGGDLRPRAFIGSFSPHLSSFDFSRFLLKLSPVSPELSCEIAKCGQS